MIIMPPLLQVLVINDEHGTIRVVQRVTGRPDQPLHFAMIPRIHDDELYRSGVLAQVLDEAAVHCHQLHVEVRIVAGPPSEPAAQLGL